MHDFTIAHHHKGNVKSFSEPLHWWEANCISPVARRVIAILKTWADFFQKLLG